MPGIWWCTGEVLVAIRDVTPFSPGDAIIQSKLDHDEFWEDVRGDFGSRRASYVSPVKSGWLRLVRDPGEGKYEGELHDGDEPKKFLREKIAWAFGVATCRIELDDE
jgi:hypothetical protein